MSLWEVSKCSPTKLVTLTSTFIVVEDQGSGGHYGADPAGRDFLVISTSQRASEKRKIGRVI